MQTVYPLGEAMAMTDEMCKRVGIAKRAGAFIISMVRLRTALPGDLVDMELVAKGVKHAGDNKEFLRPQYSLAPKYEDWKPPVDYTQKPTTKTWYKPANP